MVDETVQRTDVTVDRDRIAEEFAARMTGKLEQEKIDAAVVALRTTTATYPATCALAGAIFYLNVQITMEQDGEQFNGDSGGFGSPGGNVMWGDVYTDDLNRLYAATETFELNATPVYTSVMFFDGSSNFLGHFESGGIGTILGVYGGKGSWS
ncbi:hypothetical protein GCM10028784_32500 [Myceligenerans cantabricum]